MENRGLTEKQRSVLDFLSAFLIENGYPPSLREICAQFNIKGPKNARKHLTALEKKGFIKRSSGLQRAMRVVGKPAPSPAPSSPPPPPPPPPLHLQVAKGDGGGGLPRLCAYAFYYGYDLAYDAEVPCALFDVDRLHHRVFWL